jgi:hypothetical protein
MVYSIKDGKPSVKQKLTRKRRKPHLLDKWEKLCQKSLPPSLFQREVRFFL